MASIVEVDGEYFGSPAAFTASGQIGDVVVLMVNNKSGTVTASATNCGSFTAQDSVQATGTCYLTCLTGTVTSNGTVTVTVAGTLNTTWGVMWLVRGLSSATANQVGHNSGNNTPLTVSLTTTATCTLIAGWGNPDYNISPVTWTPGTITDDYGSGVGYPHGGGHQLAVAAGSQSPGLTAGLVEDSIICLFLPEGGAASFTASPSAIPTGHSTPITIALAGSGTTWTSSSTVSVTTLTGATVSLTSGSTLGSGRTSNTAATITVTTASGSAGTWKITVDGVDVTTAMTTVTPSVAVSPTANISGQSITLTGTNTIWHTDIAAGNYTTANLFSVSSGSLSFVSGLTTDGATGVYTLTFSGTPSITITDNSTGKTAAFTGQAAATSYTLTAPTPASGQSGVASGNFTVTPNGVYTGTITPGATGISGTFTPSSLTWSGTSSAKTFTFTPSATGTATISTTSSPGLTNPASVTYYSVLVYDLTNTAIAGVYIQPEGGLSINSYNGKNCWCMSYSNVWPEGAIRFVGTISTIDLYVYLNGGPIRLTVDGVDVSTSTMPNSSAWGWTSGLFTGLDSANPHTYLLTWGTTCYVQQVQTGGGSGIATAWLPVRPAVCGFGDSITTSNLASSPQDSTTGWLHRVGLALNYQVCNRGFDSTTVAGGGGTSGALRTGDVTTLPVPASIVIILYGTNDAGLSESLATFGNGYLSMLQLIQDVLPNSLLLNERLLKTTSTDTSRDTYSAKLATEVAAINTTKCVYAQGAYNAYPGNNGGVDNIHPDATRCIAIASAIVSDINAATPSSGVGRRKMQVIQ